MFGLIGVSKMKINQTPETVTALLIDGDNVNSEYIDAIEKELAIIGNTTHKRLYYTYSTGIPNGWDGVCNPHALTLRQVMPYTNSNNSTVKNVADSQLIIDAMDILHGNNVNCVCIVASDSDYTTITKRLRESNIRVIGMGEKRTPVAFVNACDEFKYLEDLKTKYNTVSSSKALLPDTDSDDGAAAPPTKAEIENFIKNMLEEAGHKLDAGEIKKRICKKWPSFNEVNYGATRMSKFFDTKKFKVIQEPGGNVNVDLINS